jgi:hypothetical protein
VEVAPNEILAVGYKVGKVSVFAPAAPICKVDPLETLRDPVAFPVIWKPPSLNLLPDVTSPTVSVLMVEAPNKVIPAVLLDFKTL